MSPSLKAPASASHPPRSKTPPYPPERTGLTSKSSPPGFSFSRRASFIDVKGDTMKTKDPLLRMSLKVQTYLERAR